MVHLCIPPHGGFDFCLFKGEGGLFWLVCCLVLLQLFEGLGLLVLVSWCSACCPFWLCNHLAGEELVGCACCRVAVVFSVFASRAVGLSAACNCGIYWLYMYSLTF